MATATSYRLSEELKRSLAETASIEGVSETALVTRLLEEGLKCAKFPGIVYRPGASGRRAGLLNGPDVWEIILSLRHAPGGAARKVAEVAKQLEIPAPLIKLALDFATEFPAEIEDRIAMNEAAAEHVRQLTETRARLLAS